MKKEGTAKKLLYGRIHARTSMRKKDFRILLKRK